MQFVQITQAYRLLNHGPTVLISSAHNGKQNIMAAAWNMPVEFTPPRIAVVVDKKTFTRELMALGYQDTWNRRDEVHRFFGWEPLGEQAPPARTWQA